MITAQAIHVPAACSPLEGVYLLSVLLLRQEERLEELRRSLDSGPATGTGLDAVQDGLRELHWRTRAILGAAEGGPWVDAALQALLLQAGLTLEAEGGRQHREDRLRRAEHGAALCGEIARQCRDRFAHSAYTDEFRLCQELAEELGRQLAHLRN